jgi:PAS domain S-box-containing protein
MDDAFDSTSSQQTPSHLSRFPNRPRSSVPRDHLLHQQRLYEAELETQNSDLRASQQRLTEAMARYADLYDSAPVGYVTLDRHGQILESNQTAAGLLGKSHDRLIRRPLATCLESGQVDRLLTYLHDVFNGPVPPDGTHRREFVVRCPDDKSISRTLLLESALVPAIDGTGQCRCILSDITAQRQNEQHLALAHSRYRDAIETTNDGFWLVGGDERLIEVNRAYQQRSGYSRDELLTLSISDLDIDYRPGQVSARAAEIRRTGHALFMTHHRTRDGEIWPVEVNVAYSVEGDYFSVFLRDVSERLSLQREVVDAVTMEQQRLGHELHDGIGQQLTALILMLEKIRRDQTVADRHREAEDIGQITAYMRTALEDLRRLAHGLSPVQLRDRRLADALTAFAESVCRHTVIDCFFRGQPEPAGTPEIAKLHLYRIAQEAVQNALKHAGATHIQIRLGVTPEALTLEIRDDGRGIGPAGLSGDGLGLSIMRYRMQALNGILEIGDNDGRGTRVRCVVPIAEAVRE